MQRHNTLCRCFGGSIQPDRVGPGSAAFSIDHRNTDIIIAAGPAAVKRDLTVSEILAADHLGGMTVADEFDMAVKYIGVGEGIDDLREFDPEEFAGGIFDE